MALPVENANKSVPDVLPISQDQTDRMLKSVERVVGPAVAALFEKNLGERDSLLERQFERTEKAIAAQLQYKEQLEGKYALGAVFQGAMKAKADGTRAGAADLISEHLEKTVGKSVAKAINLADASEGGIFIEGTTLEMWLEPLRASSVVLSLDPIDQPVTGDQLEVTGFESDPTLYWVQEENTAEIQSTPASGLRQAPMRKAMALIPVTADFRESASPAVLARLEDLMRAAFRVGFDEKYITGSGNNNNIMGLRSHITSTSAQTGTTLANIFTDVSIAMNSIESSNVPTERLGVIMAPRSKYHLMFGALDQDNRPFFLEEMTRGTWLGLPYRSTTSVPTNLSTNQSYVIWFAANQFFVGRSTGLDVRWYENASYTLSGNLVSSIERDTEVLRGRQKTATLMPHRNSGYVLTGVTWGV